mgnify:CR=1 FL=1
MQPKDSAIAQLKQAGLAQITIENEYSDSIASGAVTRVDPGVGSTVEAGTAGTIWVSTGKQQISVPSVVGMSYANAKSLLESYGFRVYDLGRDVPPEVVCESVRKTGCRLVGLSALMTTTVPSMAATIDALKHSGHPCKTLVGGAVLTPEYATEIGADYYAKDAKQSADIAKEVLG